MGNWYDRMKESWDQVFSADQVEMKGGVIRRSLEGRDSAYTDEFKKQAVANKAALVLVTPTEIVAVFQTDQVAFLHISDDLNIGSEL